MAAPSDPYALLHYNMIHAHNTFKAGYESIIAHLDNPPTDDLRNFLGYCEAWSSSIAHHHDVEEESVFPILSKKMDFSGEQQEHKAIHAFLDAFLASLHAAQSDPQKFNAASLKEQLQASKDTLYTHLDGELVHVGAAKLKEAQFTESDVIEMVATMAKQAKSKGDPFLVVPFMRSHTPPQLKETWPPMPWVLRKVVVPYLLAMRYSGYWKYSPYAMS